VYCGREVDAAEVQDNASCLRHNLQTSATTKVRTSKYVGATSSFLQFNGEQKFRGTDELKIAKKKNIQQWVFAGRHRPNY
jgi:hypothetical protein